MSNENNMIKKLSGKINYDTCKKVEVASLPVGLSAVLANNLPVFDTPALTFFGLFSIASAYFLISSNAHEYTKDVNEVRKLYDEFLKKYDKLNQLFDLKNPVEICTMYYYLLYKGYLSKDKEFVFSPEDTKNIVRLLGSEVIRGNGVCRHIAMMLCDILNERGIKSFPIGAYSYPNLIINLFDEETKDLVLKTYSQVRKGNHMIVYSENNNKSYFLDPTTILTFYRLSKKYEGILESDEKNLIIKKEFSKAFNTKEDYKWLKDNLLKEHSYISKEKERKMVDKTISTASNNSDIFEKFFKDNKELYSEIDNGISKIKIPKRF